MLEYLIVFMLENIVMVVVVMMIIVMIMPVVMMTMMMLLSDGLEASYEIRTNCATLRYAGLKGISCELHVFTAIIMPKRWLCLQQFYLLARHIPEVQVLLMVALCGEQP